MNNLQDFLFPIFDVHVYSFGLNIVQFVLHKVTTLSQSTFHVIVRPEYIVMYNHDIPLFYFLVPLRRRHYFSQTLRRLVVLDVCIEY